MLSQKQAKEVREKLFADMALDGFTVEGRTKEGRTEMRCVECNKVAVWARHTQFAGTHPYCDEHAKAQTDFLKEDSYTFWENIDIVNKRRKEVIVFIIILIY